MSLTAAGILAMLLSFAACIAAATWHVAAWLPLRSRAGALIPLLWVHAFRHVALQILSAQKAGFAVSDGLRDHILYGDLVGMVLAPLAMYEAALASPSRWCGCSSPLQRLTSSTEASAGCGRPRSAAPSA